MSQKPVVSICCITYNHAAFIGQTLEGFVSQVTDFPFEAIVHDDASTDGTADIIRDYAERYPAIIKPIFQTENQYRKERGRVTRTVFQAATGRYVAMCEGDDYWTDPSKLQKQVDHLEREPDVYMCFHRSLLLRNDAFEPHVIPAEVDLNDVRSDDLLRTYNFIATASVVFRNDVDELPDWFWQVPFGDLALHHIHASKGRVTCLPDTMAVYRIVAAGAWSQQSVAKQRLSYLEFYRILFPQLTAPQRAIVATKRAEILERMAHERYPVNPRKKWVFKKYLQLKHQA